MNYKDLFINKIHILRELIFFRKWDILEINENDFNKWIEKGFIINQYDDIYSLSEEHIELTKITRFFLMQKYFENSYISGCSALEDYWVYLAWNRHHTIMLNKDINEDMLIIKNKRVFIYKTYVKNYEDLVNKKIIELWNRAMWLKSSCYLNIASLELALIDLFSIQKYVMNSFDFNEHWLYWEKIDKIINKEKLLDIAKNTNEEYIINSTKNFITWLKNKEYERFGTIW